ncbi:non-hydrolyzing UDP-N-acetylglucosamine 2-epimerase [Paraurantiacibacter namhicola]|uniref:UDP-N-acetylglucosamine 2-epimerase (non-hydrolyzing) n=1 Tax=Paraurantiacibacter namhicola TaxID=645517 RepID=A0A1C7D6R9_9SPHN|nr:UDP-N-acetylglucosamine 2-epimerase (non-hydrolyzing) [Paraurantiacibacter namhicola]ANU07154.1 UDP-N-acetylglucosamine 2-epimerase [Paraurantiacibacter namhicola]
MSAPAKSGAPRILVSFGTRPEAIKMFPVVHALREHGGMDVRVALTAQHRELLDQVMEIGGISADIDLDLMTPGQSLDALSARIITKYGAALDEWEPDRVIVHGDTLTTMMVTLASYFRRIPVGHVEAGLRSGNIYSPWPEEVNRKVTGAVADLNFAPTEGAAEALRRENVSEDSIFVTGNTVIDALLATHDKVKADPSLASGLDDVAARFAGKRIVGLTAHRRENFGEGMQNIAAAVAEIARREDVAVVFPVHPNPNVRPVMEAALGHLDNVALIEPLDYPHFVRLMGMAELLLTDSGGVQEEAPSLGKPVLVMRDTTERPEGVDAGTAKLVATDRARIVSEANRLLDDKAAYDAMAQAHNPYGDGKASARIAKAVAEAHGL